MFAIRSWRKRRIERGTSGAFARRASTSTNSPSSATPAASGPSTPGEPQPSVSVRTIPYVRPTRLAVTSTAPATSKLRVAPASRPPAISRRPSTITIAPSGTLTAKIAGQPRPCVSTPPSSAPEEPPSAPIAPHMPTARLRSGPALKELVTIDSVAGERIAPPSPCTARAPSSRLCESDSAQASEESENSAVPARNTLRLPSRSAERPPSIRNPAKVSVYALTTHCSPVVEKCRPLWIDGSATLTIEMSRMTMNCARQTISSRALFERALGVLSVALMGVF